MKLMKSRKKSDDIKTFICFKFFMVKIIVSQAALQKSPITVALSGLQGRKKTFFRRLTPSG
jgi:hypothetical protein